MGAASRRKPRCLAKKLLQIRLALGLSQGDMVNRLGLADDINRNYISGYERATREPELHVLLRYAKVAGIYTEVLIDDELDLPESLPHSSKSEGVLRKKSSRKKQK